MSQTLAGAAEEIRELMAACMQCGTCSASCPNASAMDLSPRRLWRLAQLGRMDELTRSRSFWLCSACYSCALRCPRGLPTTQAMYALKRLAAELRVPGARRRAAFYESFADNIERYGRVQETALVNAYLRRMADPLLALSYVPTGLKMLGKGKLHATDKRRRGMLDPLLARVREMEERP